jgi:alpha-beta hydrolase superfamily lysophospholipase
MMRSILAASVAAASLVGASCGSNTAKTTDARSALPSVAASMPAAPVGDLYQPPTPLPLGDPGSLIWAERDSTLNFDPPQVLWRILYHSRDANNRDVAVSGFAIVPVAAAPNSGRAVYAWAHGTTGLGDQCAPSKSLKDSIPPYAGSLVGGNAVVVATDYEGLGTPGDHTYLAGVPEGQAMLDSIRAAAALPNAGPIGDVVLAGQSQGGGAALFAAQLAPTYAPELPLRGVVASAPAAELSVVATAARTSPFKASLLLAASGLRAAYPDFDVSSFLTQAAIADLSRVANECVDATNRRYQSTPITDILTADPGQVPAVAAILLANSPGAVDPKIPIMIVQGANDEQIPVAVSADLAAKYCRLGANTTRVVYPGASHDGVIDSAQDDAVRWINDRYKHKTAKDGCAH